MNAIAKNNKFTEATVLSILESDEEFPIDLNDAWKWLGFRRKEAAKSLLLDAFIEGLDFFQKPGKATGGRPSEVFRLTVDCFKALGMMANTDKGKEVRKYFIECERQLKCLTLKLDSRIAAMEAKFESRLAAIEAKLENMKPSHAEPTRPQLQSAEDRSAAQKTREQQELYWLSVKGSYTNASVESLMRKFRW